MSYLQPLPGEKPYHTLKPYTLKLMLLLPNFPEYIYTARKLALSAS